MKLKLQSGKSEILINKDLRTQLLYTKNQIDPFYDAKVKINNNYFKSKWEIYRSLCNKYEIITKNKQKLNRAYFKLKEIVLDDLNQLSKLKSVATLAEGPGGFIQFISDYYPKTKIYGITLRYDTETAAKSRHFKISENENIKIVYGEENNPQHDGNLYNKDVVNGFANQVGKVDLVTADGGFEAKDENNKETEHLKLFLAETLTAFKVLNKNGSFILKIYDIFTRPTLELLFLLSSSFKQVEIKKPVSSRPANSERYVVCHGFKGFNTDIHVNIEDGEYSSILDMTDAEKKRFEKFVYNLEKQNEEYVNRVISNINEVLNFITINENNKVAKRDKEKEQEMFKEVWEKVYEKKERKEKRSKKKVSKKGLNVEAKEFVL